MRVLFASTQGAGHFNPLVPFAHAFRRAGHELVVVGPPVLAERAEAAGLPFRPGRRPPEDVLGRVWEQVPRLPPAQGEVAVVGTIFARLNVEAMLPAHRAAMADWQPDLVVREPSEFASAVAAEEHGIRHVRVGIGLALVEQGAVAFAAPALEEWRPGLVGRIDASPYLTCLPESLDPAPWPVRRFRDPALDAPAQPLADWWPGLDEAPLVYVSFGSVAAELPPAAAVYRHALEAVADLPARVLLTLGLAGDLELGAVPPNVHVERWVPQGHVLAHAAAVVCHGGSGTTFGALAAGVPVVAVPLFADQPHNAARVAIAGAGVVAGVDGIGPALTRVLGDASYAAAAARVADELRRLPPVDDAVVALAGNASAM